MKFHHIGLCCANIELEKKLYKKIGAKNFTKTYIDRKIKVKVCFFHLGGLRYELVSPLTKNSPVKNLIKKNRIYHVAYTTKKFDEKIRFFKKKGCIQISTIVRAIALNNRKICFIFMPNKDLIELIEE
jgi:methylmalonyl-CoA/ethylmalonyl-CoA epimerase